MESVSITSAIKQFNYYKTVGDKTLEQLTFEEMIWQPNEASNSISVIVKHMVGNMLSSWTNIRNEEHQVSEAISRQLAQYPYHIRQILFIGKMLKGNH